MNDLSSIVKKVKELIGTNQTEKAITMLEEAQLPFIETELILVKADFYKVTEQQQIELIKNDDADFEIRQINNKLIGICDKILRTNTTERSAKEEEKNHPLKKYLTLILITIIPISIMLFLLGFGIIANPFKEDVIPPRVTIMKPNEGDYPIGDPIKIDYSVTEASGNLTMVFIEKGEKSTHSIEEGVISYSTTGYNWSPPESLSGKTGYIQIKTADGTTGRSAEIKLLKPVEEEKIIDLKVDYFRGKARWSKSPDSLGRSDKPFRYAFTLDYESRIINDSSVDGPISYQLTLYIMSKLSNEWEVVNHLNDKLQKGEPKNHHAAPELFTYKYGGRPLVPEDYIFKLCIENSKDGNIKNNCVIDTFRTNAVTY